MGKSGELPKLRLQQLKDLARAYGINIPKDGTKPQILPLMEAAESAGAFLRPPKNPYYFEKAKWSPDALKEAKIKGGFIDRKIGGSVYRIPVPVFHPWRGPDPEGDLEEKRVQEKLEKPLNYAMKEANRAKNAEMAAIRKRAEELGVKLRDGKKGQKSKAWMLEQIAIAEGKKAPE